MVDVNRLVDVGDLNDIHVVTRYELALAMVGLASVREVFWAIHPVHAQIDMSLAAGAYFENTGDPEFDLGVVVAQLVWDLDKDVLVYFEVLFSNSRFY